MNIGYSIMLPPKGLGLLHEGVYCTPVAVGTRSVGAALADKQHSPALNFVVESARKGHGQRRI
jgi:hypothetical protein